MEPKDIEICHKLNRKGNKPIIVKFISHKVKTNLYRARAKLKNVRVSNIFPLCSSSTLVQAQRIILNENLTSYRKKIMTRANEMWRNDELLSVWSMDRSIYVKTSPQGKPVRINELQDLDYLYMSNCLAKEDKNCNLHLGQKQTTQSSEKKKGNAHKLL